MSRSPSRQQHKPLIINRSPREAVFNVVRTKPREGIGLPLTQPGDRVSCKGGLPSSPQPRLLGSKALPGLEVGPTSATGAWSPGTAEPQGSGSYMTVRGQMLPPSRAATKRLPSYHPGILSQNGFSASSEDSKEHSTRSVVPARPLH